MSRERDKSLRQPTQALKSGGRSACAVVRRKMCGCGVVCGVVVVACVWVGGQEQQRLEQ